MTDIFSSVSTDTVNKHHNEFFLNDSGMMIHLTCGWNYTSHFDPVSPWALRAVMIGHMERDHPELMNDEAQKLQREIEELNAKIWHHKAMAAGLRTRRLNAANRLNRILNGLTDDDDD